MSGKLIRDAVHGDIHFGPLEIELIDTPEFQRLRGIKQLGTAYLVFPSALHTRFEHSLGTSWMAHRLIDVVRRTHALNDADAELIRIAALLHDITHIPFGHTLEDERRVLPRHDKDQDRVRYFLEEGNIGKANRLVSVFAGSELVVTLGGKPLTVKENDTLEVFAGPEPPRQRIIRSRAFAENVGLLSAYLASRSQ